MVYGRNCDSAYLSLHPENTTTQGCSSTQRCCLGIAPRVQSPLYIIGDKAPLAAQDRSEVARDVGILILQTADTIGV